MIKDIEFCSYLVPRALIAIVKYIIVCYSIPNYSTL